MLGMAVFSLYALELKRDGAKFTESTLRFVEVLGWVFEGDGGNRV